MRRALLIVLVALSAVACGSTTKHLWVTSAHPRTFTACVSSDCGAYSATLNWQIPAVAGQTGYNLLVNGSQYATASSSPFTYTGLDCNTSFTLGVQAHNSGGTGIGTLWTMSYTTPACPTTGAAPSNTAEPIASGTVATGQVVSTTNGSWTNTPTSYSYQWQDCPTDGTACTNITGATSSTYTVASGDAGDVLRAQVTANNAGGSSSPASSPMIPFGDVFNGSSVDTNVWTVVHQHGDQSQSEPECYEPSLATVSGNVLSETLTGTGDSSCPSNSINPTGVAASTLTSGEVQAKTFSWEWGKEFAKIQFSAPNGSWPAIWSLTATQCEVPTNLDNCVNTGPDEMDMAEIIADNYTHVNEQLHVNGNNPGCDPAISPDVYSGYHIYEMDWTSTQVVFKIDGTTTCTLTTTSTWPSESPQFPIIDTAANCTCTGLPTSTNVAWVYITTNSPDNTAQPTLTDTTSPGRFQHGDALSLSNGTWTGSPTSFAYQWHRCNPSTVGNNPPPCSVITGATSSTYTTTTSDTGNKIYGVVTATTANGGAAAYTTISPTVS